MLLTVITMWLFCDWAFCEWCLLFGFFFVRWPCSQGQAIVRLQLAGSARKRCGPAAALAVWQSGWQSVAAFRVQGFSVGWQKMAADNSGVSQKCMGAVSNYEDLAETGFQPHNATLRPPGRLRDVAGCVRNGQRNWGRVEAAWRWGGGAARAGAWRRDRQARDDGGQERVIGDSGWAGGRGTRHTPHVTRHMSARQPTNRPTSMLVSKAHQANQKCTVHCSAILAAVIVFVLVIVFVISLSFYCPLSITSQHSANTNAAQYFYQRVFLPACAFLPASAGSSLIMLSFAVFCGWILFLYTTAFPLLLTAIPA